MLWLIAGLGVLVLSFAVVFVSRHFAISQFLTLQPGPTHPDFIDEFLIRWYRFAFFDKRLAHYIRAHTPAFEARVVTLLGQNPERGLQRLAMYAILQVGAFFGTTSALGAAVRRSGGGEVRECQMEDGRKGYFAADLYEWFEIRRDSLAPYALYEEWRQSEFARQTVIPMYMRLSTEGKVSQDS